MKTYMTALGKSDYATVKGLFAAGGKVLSPFLGEMLAHASDDTGSIPTSSSTS